MYATWADGFRWRARGWHLCYCGHVPPALLVAKLERATSIKAIGTSIVHELSDAKAPYPHTHFAWLWERAPNLHGARLMDVEIDGLIIHPHVVHKKSLKWLQSIFQRYHAGWKSSAAGKQVFVAPVAGPWQVLPECFEWNDYIISEVSEASDLIEGAQMAGVSIRSVHDVMLVQSAKRARAFEHNFRRDSYHTIALPEAYTSGAVGTLHIWGAIRLGKSEWALSQFAHPLLVTDRNDLLGFRPGWHDGTVIDKIMPRERPPAGFTLQEREKFTDFTLPASIRCLYKTAQIPKGVRKIVVTTTCAMCGLRIRKDRLLGGGLRSCRYVIACFTRLRSEKEYQQVMGLRAFCVTLSSPMRCGIRYSCTVIVLRCGIR